MSIEEIISVIEELADGAEERANDYDYVVGVRNTHAKKAEALREAIALLRIHPDAQPNEPLTLEELREMDGQPVVVVKGNDDPMWALVTVESVNDKFWEFFIDCADGDKLRFDTEGANNFDGEEVIFYRRPPKEDER